MQARFPARALLSLSSVLAACSAREATPARSTQSVLVVSADDAKPVDSGVPSDAAAPALAHADSAPSAGREWPPSCGAEAKLPPPRKPAPPSTTQSAGPPCMGPACDPGVSLLVHLDVSRQDLLAGGSFMLCHQSECWSGKVHHQSGDSASLDVCEPSFPGRCIVEAEGSGVTMQFFFAANAATQNNAFNDGDRVALRVDVRGKTVFENVRFVRYEPQGCLGCRVASVELWPDSPTCKTCGSGACAPFVRFEAIVPESEETAGPAAVTACKNGSCQAARVDRWDWGSTLPFHTGDGHSMDDFAHRFSPMIDVSPLGKRFRVRVTFRGDARSFARGDHFTMEVHAEKSGKVLAKADQIVTDYDESYPGGGRDCTPIACRQKTFVLP